MQTRQATVNPALASQVARAVESLFPIVSDNGQAELRATNVRVTTESFDPRGLNAQQQAREQGKTLGAAITADLELWREGKRAQTRKGMKLGTVPLMTDLGTFMVKGNDYFTPMAQLRLKSGTYTRRMDNGLFETFIRVEGPALRVWMDPARGIFKLGMGTTNVDLLPVLSLLGVSDAEIVSGLGGDEPARKLLEMNRSKRPAADLDKLYKAIFERKQNKDLIRGGVVEATETGLTTEEKAREILNWMMTKELDPFVTRKTIGAAIDRLGVSTLLRSARRILDVQRGDGDPDDRDAPEFKKAYGIEDLLPERITKLGRQLQFKVKRSLNKPDATLASVLGPAWLDSATIGYFAGGGGLEPGLAHTAEAANPLAILSEASKTTMMGEGGIQSDHAISLGSRLFRPSGVNFYDPVHSPEGSQIGITVHTAVGTRKRGSTLEAPFYAVKGGVVDRKKVVYLSIEEAADAVVGYPEYWDDAGKPTDEHVRANVQGRVIDVPATSVTYVIPNGATMFDATSNAASFLSNTHANRALMAGKHLTQALPLVHRELTLTQLKTTTGRDVHEDLANNFVIRSRVAGTVTKVTPRAIWVGDEKHEIFEQYPMQAKVALHHYPVVKVGDVVTKGQLLADSNYSRDGKLALGVNLRSAYMPFRNASNFEDAIAISESAAKALTSEHIHRLELPLVPGTILDRKLYIAQFPTAITAANFALLDDTGVIKEGSVIEPGFVVIAAAQKRKFEELDRSATNLSRIHKSLERPYADAAVRWDEIFPGTVYRVVRRADKIEVHLKTEEPMQVGDKVSMSSAAKGTVSTIIPDDQMPHDEKGRPIQIIFNTFGVPGRINPSQTLEQAAGKLVRDGKVPYSQANFDLKDHAVELQKALKKAGLTHDEKLFDPVTGKWLEKPVGVGYNYVVKLDHPVRKKFSARSRDGYTADETPTRGAGKSGQSYDQLTTFALLGHNAHALLGESFGVRGTKNDDFWAAYQAGETPPPPKVPFVFERFRNLLNASGIDTQQKGSVLHYLPMTDKRVLEMSNGEILRPTQVRAKDLAEEPNGLFDPKVTGGLFGSEYGHIDLKRKIPHPLFSKVIRDLTELKQADFYGLLGGTRWLDPKTREITDEPGQGRVTGEQAFEALLDFDPKDKLRQMKEKLTTAVGSDRNRYHRATQYLRGLLETGMKPADAYLTSKIPVIPPKYRSVVEMRNGGLRVADANLLYRDVIMTKDLLHQAETSKDLPTSELAKARIALYDSVGGLIGINKPLTERRDNQELQGLLQVIKGKSNKTGLFQAQLARRRNDYTGRSTIEPDASLGPDEIGLPEDMAWKIYQAAVVRRLALLGWKPADAMKAVEERSEAARNALHEELATRNVIYTRAPALHKGSVLAARPFIHSGKDLKISPIVVGPLNADFDGDGISVTVPVTEEARREAVTLLPSKNLFYDRDRRLAFGMEKDVVAGLFALTKPGRPSGKTYATAQEAIDAYKSNRDGLLMSSLVRIGDGVPQAVGWLMFQELVPARFLAGVTAPIDGKKLDAVLTRIAKESPADYNTLSRRLAQAGFSAAAAYGGITTTIDELAIDRTKINRLLDQLEREIRKGKTEEEKREIADRVFRDVTKPGLTEAVVSHLDEVDRGYSLMMASGATGKLKRSDPEPLRQMLASPTLVSDVNDRVVPSVIKSSYGMGMRPSDYILTTPGSRKGLVARSLSTALPGFLAKEIAGNLGPVRVTEHDCGTKRGIDCVLADTADLDLLDRHLLSDIPGLAKRNEVITPALLSKLRDARVSVVHVRSSLTCEAAKPPCQMCAGRTPDGKLHAIGSNIGYSYGQAASERTTQLVMKLFHSGGTVGSGDSLYAGFARLRELLSAPAVVRHQGTLADVDGTVTSIAEAPQGGHYVHIKRGSEDIEHYVASGRRVLVKVGDHLHVGDPISDGNYRPQEIAAKKGLLAAQRYVVDEARKSYANAGATIRAPVLEVLAASTMRYVEITNDGGEKDLAPGDVLHENDYEARRKRNPAIQAVPTILGISHKPLETSKDLMERLNFQRLDDTFREVPAIAGQSDLTGSGSPLPGLAYGAMFRPEQTGLPVSPVAAGRIKRSSYDDYTIIDDEV